MIVLGYVKQQRNHLGSKLSKLAKILRRVCPYPFGVGRDI